MSSGLAIGLAGPAAALVVFLITPLAIATARRMTFYDRLAGYSMAPRRIVWVVSGPAVTVSGSLSSMMGAWYVRLGAV